MTKNIYPCFKCGEWFETTGARKAHKCGEKLKPTPVKQEAVKDVVADAPTDETNDEVLKDEISSEEISVIEFDRDEAILSLKEAGIIKDKRSTTNKSDEELMEMLKDI